MQLRVKPSAWITASGLSPACTLSTARIRISCNVLWSRARASRRFMPSIVLYVYLLMNILIRAELQRRDSDQPAEDLCEVALVCESGCLFHLADGELGAAQKFLVAIHPAPQRVLVGADASALLEELAEIVRAHPRQMR